MKLEKQSTVLALMDQLKWPSAFICLKCGNDKSIKGDNLYDRKCSKCKKNVSLTKYTAFEGLRFPVDKAYGILSFLVERAVLDLDAKVIKWYNREYRQGFDLAGELDESEYAENISDEFEYKSIRDLYAQSKQNSWNEGNIDDKIDEVLSRWSPSIGKLAKKFELEENTIVKFIEKVNLRKPPVFRGESDDPLERLLAYIRYHQNSDQRSEIMEGAHLLGMCMVPLVGEWKYGLGTVRGLRLAIKPVSSFNGPWSVFRAEGSHDNSKYSFEFFEEYRYGSKEWYELFKGME